MISLLMPSTVYQQQIYTNVKAHSSAIGQLSAPVTRVTNTATRQRRSLLIQSKPQNAISYQSSSKITFTRPTMHTISGAPPVAPPVITRRGTTSPTPPSRCPLLAVRVAVDGRVGDLDGEWWHLVAEVRTELPSVVGSVHGRLETQLPPHSAVRLNRSFQPLSTGGSTNQWALGKRFLSSISVPVQRYHYTKLRPIPFNISKTKYML